MTKGTVEGQPFLFVWGNFDEERKVVMSAYFWYLLYVGAVIAFGILLLRRVGRQMPSIEQPEVLDAAWLRNKSAGVLETIIFHLYDRGFVELTTETGTKKLGLKLVGEKRLDELSSLEQTAIDVFDLMQQKKELPVARKYWMQAMFDIEMEVTKRGWWRKTTAWKKGLVALVPLLIAVGCLRFIDYFDGAIQVALGMTVVVFAVLGRRIVAGELEGLTSAGHNLLKQLQEKPPTDNEAVWQVAIHGSHALDRYPKYRSYSFMIRGIPFHRLNL